VGGTGSNNVPWAAADSTEMWRRGGEGATLVEKEEEEEAKVVAVMCS